MLVLLSLFEIANQIYALICENTCLVGRILDMQCLLLVNFLQIRQENI